MKRIPSPVEFTYNGEEIKGALFTHYNDSVDTDYTFMFEYAGKNVHVSLGENKNYWAVAPLHCKIIDKLGLAVHDKYQDYLSDIHSIELKYIIVDNEVYNHFSKLIIPSPKVYRLNLKLENGVDLDGTNKLTDIQEQGDRVKLKDNLQRQAVDYFKNYQVKPSQEQLNKEKTKEYQKIKTEINKIHESL